MAADPAYSTGHDAVHSLRIKQIANNGEVEAVPPRQPNFAILCFRRTATCCTIAPASPGCLRFLRLAAHLD